MRRVRNGAWRRTAAALAARGNVLGLIAVTAACGNPGQDPLALAPLTLEVSTQSLPDGRVGQTYATTLSAFGGTGGYAWSLIDGELPAGVALDATGSLTGTPTEAGTSAFMVQVVSGDNQNATRQLTIEVTP